MLKKQEVLMPGDLIVDAETLEQVKSLSDTEKMALVRSAIYSDDHLFKVVFRIALIADPDNTETSLEWLKSRLSLSSPASGA